MVRPDNRHFKRLLLTGRQGITPKAQFETHPDRNRNLWMWIMSSPHNPHSEPHKSFQHLTC